MRQGVDEQKFLLVSCQFLNLLPHPPLTPPEDLGNPDLPLHDCHRNTLHECMHPWDEGMRKEDPTVRRSSRRVWTVTPALWAVA